jgi:hypothetical protein
MNRSRRHPIPANSPRHPPRGRGHLRTLSACCWSSMPRGVAFQGKTRRELGGNFFGDYKRSLRIPETWDDGDGWAVNYVGHPIHGAASGFIWLDHEDGSHDPKLGFSKEYWASRGRATAWAAVYSVQFEFGPFSEASIGNVGLRPNTTGWLITSSRPRVRSASWPPKMRSIDISLSASSPGPGTVWSAPSHGWS